MGRKKKIRLLEDLPEMEKTDENTELDVQGVPQKEENEEHYDPAQMETVAAKHLCFCHPDCFANQDHVCLALRDTRFGNCCSGGACPFYKNTEQYVEDRKKALGHLMAEGRTELIGKYLKELDEWEMEYLEELTRKGLLGDIQDLGLEIKLVEAETARLQEEAEELEAAIDVYDTADGEDPFASGTDLFSDTGGLFE